MLGQKTSSRGDPRRSHGEGGGGLGTGKTDPSGDSFAEQVSSGVQPKGDQDVLTQGRHKTIPSENSGARVITRKH